MHPLLPWFLQAALGLHPTLARTSRVDELGFALRAGRGAWALEAFGDVPLRPGVPAEPWSTMGPLVSPTEASPATLPVPGGRVGILFDLGPSGAGVAQAGTDGGFLVQSGWAGPHLQVGLHHGARTFYTWTSAEADPTHTRQWQPGITLGGGLAGGLGPLIGGRVLGRVHVAPPAGGAGLSVVGTLSLEIWGGASLRLPEEGA